jgi:hypothetical protein
MILTMQINQKESQFLFSIIKCLAVCSLVEYWVIRSIPLFIQTNERKHITYRISNICKESTTFCGQRTACSMGFLPCTTFTKQHRNHFNITATYTEPWQKQLTNCLLILTITNTTLYCVTAQY